MSTKKITVISYCKKNYLLLVQILNKRIFNFFSKKVCKIVLQIKKSVLVLNQT